VNNTSPFNLFRLFSMDINNILSAIDTAELSIRERDSLQNLRNSLIESRLEIQDYELAETRDFQLRNARNAKKELKFIKDYIASNQLNLFSAIDVAHLTARVEQIDDLVK